MKYESLHTMGLEIFSLFKSEKFDLIAEKYPYALTFDRPMAEAIKEDFIAESSIIGFDVSASEVEVTVSNFEQESDLDTLVEVFMSDTSRTFGIAVDIILHRDERMYIEGISSVYEVH